MAKEDTCLKHLLQPSCLAKHTVKKSQIMSKKFNFSEGFKSSEFEFVELKINEFENI